MRSIVEGANGILWIATFGGGLNKFNPKAETFHHYVNQGDNTNSICSDNLFSLIYDKQGNVWISTINGLNRFDPKTETFTLFLNDPEDPTSIGSNTIISSFEDSHGGIWVCTLESGFHKYDPYHQLV